MEVFHNYIDGKFCSPLDEQFIDVFNPAKDEVYGKVAASNEKDLVLAILASQKAFKDWSALGFKGRAEILSRIAILIEDHLEELSMMESIDNGKPLNVARSVDIPRSAENFRFFAEYFKHISEPSYPMDDGSLNYVKRKPLGVVGVISPWNLPLYLLTWKIAPALMAGNTVIAKPSELTPATATKLGELCQQAGLPNGVLNIVHGFGGMIGNALTKHPEVKAISFTGSTQTGKLIAANCAPQLKKYSLELGGKNPTIVFEDANIEKAAKFATKAAFSNQGQICLCGSRILVAESVYDRFKELMVKQMKKLKIGDPLEVSTDVGSLVSREHREKVQGYFDLSLSEGGKVVYQAEDVPETGQFFPPTLIENLGPETRCNREEIFGPIATIQSFKNTQEAIELANQTNHGLSASLWSQNIDTVNTVAEGLNVGMVWVNTWMKRDLRTPFGGMKDSGLGREGGEWAYRFFTEEKNICLSFN